MRKVSIVGLGLLGGSLAAAIRRTLPETLIVGVDPDAEVRRIAGEEGLADELASAPGALMRECELVVLAAPIDAILDLLPTLGAHLSPCTVVTDTGSVKTPIVARARATLPEHVWFLGGHPMAGTEGQGIRHRDPLLYENATFVLTPSSPSSPGTEGALAFLSGFLERLGCRVLVMTPEAHDEAVAVMSHLPHLLAASLCVAVGRRSGGDPGAARLAAGGFRDLTRVASSPSSLWVGIYRHNRAALAAALDELEAVLREARAYLERGEDEGVRDFLETARRFREAVGEPPRGLPPDVPLASP